MSGSSDRTEAEPADGCCRTADPRIARHFDRAIRERPPTGGLPALHATSSRLLAALRDVVGAQPSILEIGCGSGALSVALLERGAGRADGMDLSPASVELAQRRAAQAGVDARASFVVDDGAFATLARHDWVILDRVICCYRDLDHLLANSLAAAGSRYAFSVPESRGLRGLVNRALSRLEDLVNVTRGRPCPGFVHPVPVIEARLVAAGFQRTESATTGLWYVAAFDRV